MLRKPETRRFAVLHLRVRATGFACRPCGLGLRLSQILEDVGFKSTHGSRRPESPQSSHQASSNRSSVAAKTRFGFEVALLDVRGWLQE